MWIAKLKYWLKQTETLKDSRCFVQLNRLCLGAFNFQGSCNDNALTLHEQIFTFWRAEWTSTQTDSMIPTSWKWFCKHCDAMNRKTVLTLAANCQSFREEELVPPAQLLPAHDVTQTVLWSMWLTRVKCSTSKRTFAQEWTTHNDKLFQDKTCWWISEV